MKIAHFRITQNQEIVVQRIKEHLEETAILSARFAAKINMPKTGRLVGLLHDGGKYSQDYAIYLEQCQQYELGIISSPPPKGSVDHGVFGSVYVMKELYPNYHGKNTSFAKLTAEILAMVIASHHGGLRDYLSLDAATPLWSRMEHYTEHKQEEYQETKKEFIQEFPQDELYSLFYDAVCELEELINLLKTHHRFTKFQIHFVIKFLYSCLIDADRENTRHFMEETKIMAVSTGAEQETQRTDWCIYEQRLDSYLKKLQKKPCKTESEKTIRHLREEISDACYQAGEWPLGIYRLTVPTGGGKTLSSLRLSLRHMQKKKNADTGHIFQILPFTSIIEQNARVVRDALQCGQELLEHHSNVIIEGEGEEEISLSQEQYRLLTERWNVPFIFSTTVQFLNTVYSSSTQDMRRMHNLANSVIIMDEVQALPLKTIKLFGELVSFLSLVCNTTVLLCTATQPNFEQLFLGIKGEIKEIIPDLAQKFAQFKRMDVVDRTKENGYTVDEAIDFIEEAKRNVQSLLVVMNTKKITRTIYDRLIDHKPINTEILYLTTELCPAHRIDVIAHLKELLEQKKSVICVSTSILEAGVDVSFEGVIRNIAGLDSIAQSSGRGNRHGENTNYGFTYIINLRDENLGSMIEMEKGEEKTKAVFDTYRRNPEKYDHSLLSPSALADYFKKYFDASEIKEQMDYPISGDPELKNLYSYFTNIGGQILCRRYYGRTLSANKNYPWEMTYPFQTAGEKFRVIDQDTVSICVPYGKGKELISEIMGKGKHIQLGELTRLMKAAQPYCIHLYTNRLSAYQNAVLSSPMPGVLLLREGYYDEVTGIKEEQTLAFLSL